MIEQKTNGKVKWIVINAVVFIAVVSMTVTCLKLFESKRSQTTEPAAENTAAETTAVVSEAAEPLTSAVSSGITVPPVDESLFSDDAEMSEEAGLRGDVARRDMSALTAEFDGIILQPGMRVSDIIDSSHWYMANDDRLLAPGDAAYVVLDNDFWSADEIRLTDRYERNGSVILWVHNYSDEPAVLKDCVVYKYSLNFFSSLQNFSDRPVLTYRTDYYWGYTGIMPLSDHVETASYNNEPYRRYIYGSIDECQVILDVGDNGLFGVTVSYNEYYGPDFRGGDNNG